MTKIKNSILLLLFSLIIYACGDDNAFRNPFADVDHEALAISDNDSIVKFLKGHYYDATEDVLKPLETGKTALFDDSKLKIKEVTKNDINYKLYYYEINIGSPVPDPDKGNPTVADSIFVKYSGRTFSGTTFNAAEFDSNSTGIWLNMNAVIPGWTQTLINFKGGYLKKESNGEPFNGPITFLNSGKCIIFIPSGLAYPSSIVRNQSSNLVDTNLLFFIDLLDFVEDTDQDNDNVPSIKEDIDGDDDVNNDDTDKDGLPNFLDTDDDGDGVLTKNEDRNGNGDPTDDKNDPNNPDLPDYLNKNIK
ncbi:FKBP-type peptidyl-prolyl cis-trans isomerase [Polaribacter sp.]|uniref:FKBP-type peptidyl-prolyl cis-trans isomerase n=1 Tax=Polaribacter sp. TaxID=1920175 RepID=UPI004048A6FC